MKFALSPPPPTFILFLADRNKKCSVMLGLPKSFILELIKVNNYQILYI